jgi:hypothetical protein
MPDILPPPLIDSDCDLSGLPFMPLEVDRLTNSEWWIEAMAEDPRAAAAAVNLWVAAWRQPVPASLPNNQRVLARLAMVDWQVWTEVADRVLAKWILCDDGRLYHPVVAEKAMDAWRGRVAFMAAKRAESERGKAAAEARWGAPKVEAQKSLSGNDNRQKTPLEACARIADAIHLRKKEEVLREEKDSSPKLDLALPVVDPPEVGITFPPDFERWWGIYPRKVGKGAAFKAWKAAKSTIGGRGASARLEKAASALRQACAGKDPRFIPHPTTWLNSGRYDDPEQDSPTDAAADLSADFKSADAFAKRWEAGVREQAARLAEDARRSAERAGEGGEAAAIGDVLARLAIGAKQ